MYTKFVCCTKNESGKWVAEFIYYMGDHYNRERNDWRFCYVYKARPELQFCGYVDNI